MTGGRRRRTSGPALYAIPGERLLARLRLRVVATVAQLWDVPPDVAAVGVVLLLLQGRVEDAARHRLVQVVQQDAYYYLNKMMIDTALDRSIVLGYGRIGLLARRRLPGWPADPPRIDGAAVLVTGAASGLGLAAATGFARLGATVHAHARDSARAEQAVAKVTAAVPDADVRPHACDLASLGAVRSFAHRIAGTEPRLDVLVNNAGVMPGERTRSADGHELMFATHVLAPLALTTLLTGLLVASAPARIINVSSGGMYTQPMPAGDWESDHTAYGPKKLYARTKREQVAITAARRPAWRPRRGRARNAPGMGRQRRPAASDADVPEDHTPDHPHRAAGRRHDRLARRRARAAPRDRPVLA